MHAQMIENLSFPIVQLVYQYSVGVATLYAGLLAHGSSLYSTSQTAIVQCDFK